MHIRLNTHTHHDVSAFQCLDDHVTGRQAAVVLYYQHNRCTYQSEQHCAAVLQPQSAYSAVRAVPSADRLQLMLAYCWLCPCQNGTGRLHSLCGRLLWPSGWLPASRRPALLSAAAGTCRALQGIVMLRKMCCDTLPECSMHTDQNAGSCCICCRSSCIECSMAASPKQGRRPCAMLCNSRLHCCMQSFAGTCCCQCTAGPQLNTVLQSMLPSGKTFPLDPELFCGRPLHCCMQSSAGSCWGSTFSCAETARQTTLLQDLPCCVEPPMQQPHALPLLAALHWRDLLPVVCSGQDLGQQLPR